METRTVIEVAALTQTLPDQQPASAGFSLPERFAMYLYQAIRAWLVDWFLDRWLAARSRTVSKWRALKSKALAALTKLRTRNTGDR